MKHHASPDPGSQPELAGLKWLSILHMGLGALIFVAFPLVFLLSFYVLPNGPWGGPISLLGFMALFALAVALMASSRVIDARRRRTFSLICSALALVLFPVGTTIAVYSLIVLTRGDTVAAYAQARTAWNA
jgi:hypothetical protein